MSEAAETPSTDHDGIDAAFQALYELFSDPRRPHRAYRTYILEYVTGDWIFRQEEFSRKMDEILDKYYGPDPDDADRPRVFKLG